MNNITLVTGLWEIGRGNLTEGWSRSYHHYLEKFEQLLDTPNDMIIFGDEELQEFVFKKRKEENTQFVVRDLSWFKNNDFYTDVFLVEDAENFTFNNVGFYGPLGQNLLVSASTDYK